MFQDFGLWCLSYLASEEHFVDHRVDFVKVKYQIQFAHIVEVFIEYLDKIMYCLQIAQIIVVHIDTYAEVQTRISAINNFEIAKLQKEIEIKLIRIYTDYYSEHWPKRTSTKLVCFASLTVTTACTSSMSFCFSSSSKFMYHLAKRVLPARFCIRMKRI